MDSEMIFVFVDDCTFYISPDIFLENSTLPNIKKFFKCVFKEEWRNTDAIRILGDCLSCKLKDAKMNWNIASRIYQNEYVDTRFRYDLNDKLIQKIKSQNNKMLNEVKRCKNKYERWKKISDNFNTYLSSK